VPTERQSTPLETMICDASRPSRVFSTSSPVEAVQAWKWTGREASVVSVVSAVTHLGTLAAARTEALAVACGLLAETARHELLAHARCQWHGRSGHTRHTSLQREMNLAHQQLVHRRSSVAATGLAGHCESDGLDAAQSRGHEM